MFLKKMTKWDGGKTIVPVDQEKSSKTRETFSKTYHGRSASAIESFWQQQIFSGKDVPPAVKDKDADVMAFIKANPNAIGYVSAGTTLGEGIKAVTVSGL
jgi:ABC-type phosphate transport system substrate-binding protein